MVSLLSAMTALSGRYHVSAHGDILNMYEGILNLMDHLEAKEWMKG
jgi:hypothetical protein